MESGALVEVLMLLDWAGLTISFFNAISLLWLGLMVVLTGDRRSTGTWLTGAGMLLGALFFASHTAILGRGIESFGFGMDFWWWVSWAPAVIAPAAWYGAMLWTTGLRWRDAHPYRWWSLVVIASASLVALLLVFANPLPSYDYVAQRTLIATPDMSGVPLLII
ncbi:MAG: hypothetical protein JXB35_06800, partial [Anaerolineae bacterium]|nr:hypothetical protein [Anaerolineae bacterium]